jgi:single-stranded-DNA-specific exonuclease
MAEKRWVLPTIEQDAVKLLVDRLRISPLTAQVMAARGIVDPDEAQAFLQPRLTDLIDPCRNTRVAAAARFLLDAARASKHITVYGDYDADGICASAVVERCLRFIGADADIYIPHRIDEGYGLNREAIAELARNGTNIIVTVDSGVSSFDEVQFAREQGIEIVITDHHEPGDGVPDAVHVLNPKLPDSAFGYEYLCGAGVAFKLVWAIGQCLSGGDRVSDDFKDMLIDSLGLVAIATVADCVPLVKENRVLVQYGLKSLAGSASPGMQALLQSARPSAGGVSARDVAFRIAPQLNAAGRMGDASIAAEMLTTTDEETGRRLAGELAEHNKLRRRIQSQALSLAEEMLEADPALAKSNCLVLCRSDWHQGVVGLVASRLADRLWRPAFILVEQDGMARGSGRSVPSFSLFDAVEKCADLLDRFGGHDGAAGLSLPVQNIPEFAERMDALAGQALGTDAAMPELLLDGETDLTMLTLAAVRELDRLEPCGKANPRPLFAVRGARLVGFPQIMAERHLAFWVRQGKTTLRAFAPNSADMIEELRARKDEEFSLAFAPRLNHFRGQTSVELGVEDLQWR